MCFTPVHHKRESNQKRPIQAIKLEESDEASSSDEEYLYMTDRRTSKVPTVKVRVNDVEVEMIVDTGASTDILDEVTFQQIHRRNSIVLQPSSKRLFAYGSTDKLQTAGQFNGFIAYQSNQCVATIHVLKGNHGSLLSCKTATALGILDVHIKQVQEHTSLQDQLCAKYPSLFRGIGKLKSVEVKLHIDQTVKPVAQQARRIPFHVRQKVEEELDGMERKGIIERVYGPTPWVSPLVITPKKNGEVRVCVDVRMANRAISRERRPMPTVDDLIHSLNGATVFSKLDLRAGYHQLSLSPECRYITTFATHKGLWRYTRLNFGTNSASEIFQKVIQDQLRDIPGSLNISDDVIVFGKTQADHDAALDAVCRRFADVNLTLNKKKCEFNKSALTFFGFVFSEKGIAPDPKKMEAVKNAPAPTTASGVRSFLGMATYCAKFMPKFSDVSAPLRELTTKHTQFHWSNRHDKSFQKIKDLLTSAKVMAYFDPDKETELTTDASPTGLSAILVQRTPGSKDRRVVSYISRTLTPVERRYSQTEKEALAIVWAIEKLHIYLFGSHFKLFTDCKPIQLIIDNPNSKPPARIERWNLRLQSYDFEAVHTKGSQNPSDFLSRHATSSEERQRTLAEEYVCFLAANAVPKAMTLDEIQLATKQDKTLQCVSWLIRSQQWHKIKDPPTEHQEADKSEVLMFKHVKDELTVSDESDVILRNSRVVIPSVLREKAISIAHEGHQGLVKTKQLLREKVWFPGIDQLTKRKIKTCLACQANSTDSHPEPLQMSALPPAPWHTVHTDFCGPFPTGEYLLVVIDAYSRFPEVDTVRSTSAAAIIPKLDRIFATHGIPVILRSDNGPPFSSHEIKTYMKEKGIHHKKITPLWPQANSEAEGFMKPLTKAIRSAHTEGKQWTNHLYEFLLNYRTTPHGTTGHPPATLLFNRSVRNKLPQITPTVSDKDHQVRERDRKAKDKMKKDADIRRRATPSDLKVGDKVLVRQRRRTKFSTRFDPRPFEVTERKGTMVTARRDNNYITRNVSMFKKILAASQGASQEESEDDLSEEDTDTPFVAPPVIPPIPPAPPEDHVPVPRLPVRRSSRPRNNPQRYGSYVYYKTDCYPK